MMNAMQMMPAMNGNMNMGMPMMNGMSGQMMGMPMMNGMSGQMMGMPMMNGMMPMMGNMGMMPMMMPMMRPMMCKMTCEMSKDGMVCKMMPMEGVSMDMMRQCCEAMNSMMAMGMPCGVMMNGMPMMMCMPG